MPIRYAETLKDLKNDEKEDLFTVLKKVHEVIRNVYKTSAITTGIQTGAAAGQTIKVMKYDNLVLIKERP
jgi:diadenosine tetraphosphate (Ap4A) HIT family hydrolase